MNIQDRLKTIESRLRFRYGAPSAWRIKSLFFGARDETEVTNPLNLNYLKRAGFSAARNVVIDNKVPVKLPTQDSMIGAKYSPLAYDGKEIRNELTGESIPARDYPLEVPKSITTLLPTASGTVGLMAYSGCQWFDKGNECEFCTLSGTEGVRPVKAETVVRELSELLTSGYRATNLTINTGQLAEYGDDLRLVSEIVNNAKDAYPLMQVAAEVGPFSFPKGDIGDFVRETGLDAIDTFMLNVEMVNDAARKKLCPSKPSLQRYLQLIEGLTDAGYFATSVVQMNFYPMDEDIVKVTEFANKVAENPRSTVEFLVSRAVPGSRLGDSYWQKLSEPIEKDEAQQMMVDRFNSFEARLDYITSHVRNNRNYENIRAGCVACGMCNINREMA